MTSRQTLSLIHRTAGALALATIAGFLTSTIAVELFGGGAEIRTVKVAILWCLPHLTLAMAATAVTGNILAGPHPIGRAAVKRARMRIVAPNGVLVLIPAALFLAWRASIGAIDESFYAVQAIEILAGATNLTLIGLNMRDGLAMTRRRRNV